nr:MAG TPA: hypothetical protein [Bacteriophage sp.]
MALWRTVTDFWSFITTAKTEGRTAHQEGFGPLFLCPFLC